MPLANPYAKKLSAQHRPSQSINSSNNVSKQTTRGAGQRQPTFPSSAPPAAAAASTMMPPSSRVTTFSQSFESVEESTHYQQSLRNSITTNNNNNNNTDEAQARAQQRAFDAAAAAAAAAQPQQQQQPGDTTTKTLSDRDHHALLQPHVLYVSNRQRGNGVLNYIRNIPYAYSKMVPDYIFSPTRCALFLSCKYHSLYPDYIHKRIAELKTDFTLRVLLVLVDVEDNANTLLILNKLAVTHNLTLILAWSEEEAGRYLETFKAFDGKDASLIQARKDQNANFVDQVTDFLGTCKSINKTDAGQLVSQFGTLRSVMAASVDELGLVPGMGEVKVKRLHDAFHKPFSSKAAAAKQRRKKALLEEEAAKDKEPDDDDDDDNDNNDDETGEEAEEAAKDKEPDDDNNDDETAEEAEEAVAAVALKEKQNDSDKGKTSKEKSPGKCL